MPLNLLLIALGGAIGSVMRYAISGWVQRLATGAVELFPIGTLAVNAAGCLLIGLLAALFASPHMLREETRLFLLVGVLGGFTTFSTFGLETFQLINDRQWTWAAANVLVTNVACLASVWIAYRLGERWWGA